MSILTQHRFRLFLVIALILSPVQSLFAAPADQQFDTSVITVAASDTAQSGALKMLADDCGKNQGKCANCQIASSCGNCTLSVGISQSTQIHFGLYSQVQSIISTIPLYNTDLLPDYRPPRYS